MIDKLFKLIAIIFVSGFLLLIIPLIIYLFILQPLKLRESVGDKFPIGAFVMANKLSYKFGSPKIGDIIVFKSLKNPDIDEVGIINKIEQETIFVENNLLPLQRSDIIGKVSFCYSNCN